MVTQRKSISHGFVNACNKTGLRRRQAGGWVAGISGVVPGSTGKVGGG